MLREHVLGELLTQEQVDALPEGQLVLVKWSGGNGPHVCVVCVDQQGRRFAGDPKLYPDEPRDAYLHRQIEHVGSERWHTKVSLYDPNVGG